MWSKSIQVHPWIGTHYTHPQHFLHKTLILGESNFTKPERFNWELVQACVKNDISKDPLEERDTTGFCRFSTKIRRMIFGRNTTLGPEDFWQDVTFYNFVQVLVGERSRIRPTQEMWSVSVPAFIEIVSTLKPERVLVLGKANWGNLLTHIENKEIDEHRATLFIGDERVKAGYINHPSSNVSYCKWRPIANALLLN